MRWFRDVLVLAGVATATLNLRQTRPELMERMQKLVDARNFGEAEEPVQKRQQTSPFLNDNTRKFLVNGTGIPEVKFDVGESYAGLLPIGDANDTNKLYFWFFPSTNPAAQKEITFWITGGPGCASSGELMQENGPFLWQPGVFAPVANKWSWHHLTNMVWIDQPVGAGFSQGNVTARNEEDVAKQFMGFWKNFMTLFAMQGYKVYVTGSSYSGMYCPYIASAMLDANDTEFYDVRGMQIYDGLYSFDQLHEDIPAASFIGQWARSFAFNDSSAKAMVDAADKCGYTEYLEKYLVFPPAGQQPSALPGINANRTAYLDGCSVWNDAFAAANELNPCFSVYAVNHKCPLLYDPLGFGPSGNGFIAAGSGPVFLNRPDVKAAINAPTNQEWVFCNGDTPVFVNNIDESLEAGPGSLPVLPNVIDRTQNVIIGQGSQDFILIADGALLAIQNLTWGGRMGFQARPSAPFYVPYHDNGDAVAAAGSGVVGTVHSERGLTYVAVESAGHFFTMDAPAAAYRTLEILLGRVPGGFNSTAAFSTDTNLTAQAVAGDLGGGTVPIGLAQEQACGQAVLGGADSTDTVKASSSSATGLLTVLRPDTLWLAAVAAFCML